MLVKPNPNKSWIYVASLTLPPGPDHGLLKVSEVSSILWETWGVAVYYYVGLRQQQSRKGS